MKHTPHFNFPAKNFDITPNFRSSETDFHVKFPDAWRCCQLSSLDVIHIFKYYSGREHVKDTNSVPLSQEFAFLDEYLPLLM